MYRRAWLPALLWTSETYDVPLVREEVLQCVYRVVHVQRHGAPRTLGEMLGAGKLRDAQHGIDVASPRRR